ncbi:MAG: hypothetical protein A3F11_00470 [Gammaproteobacteria bacterium RIFCSPHIGHO2_12_FULL_37_14]|nr:MAG: hypothetical protein A3F11_00470 [Gammaproteobacteria bacterium RIFCSPHIGHO2_12_FULL_37_14]
MAQEEIIKLKAEIFDIIRQQELYVANANHLQQKRTEKLQELRDAEQKGVSEEITKIKSQAFDIMIQQEAYISETNKLQQMKTQKLQILNELEQNLEKQQVPQQAPIQQP